MSEQKADQQGRHIDENGSCIWKRPPKPKLQHIVGKHYKIIGMEASND
jgi:hypothetical protein